ncbi:MAG: Mov34/MPN/PAD-1 family protein [Lactococcus petauri]
MLIKLSNGSRDVTIEVSARLINELQRFRQLRNESESGGVFVGKRLLDGVILIVDFSKPAKGDLQKRCRFSKKSLAHQEFVNGYFENSSGYVSLVGEWHSHPEDHPSASSIDKRSWEKIISENDEQLFFLIIGRVSWTIYIKDLNKWKATTINLEEYLKDI